MKSGLEDMLSVYLFIYLLQNAAQREKLEWAKNLSC